MKFKVGDRVCILKSPYDNFNIVQGSKGTVVETMNNGFVGIEFDENIYGHDCSGICQEDFGWYCDENDVELINNPKSLLKSGYIVEVANGNRYWVILNKDKLQFVNDGWLKLSDYDDDLRVEDYCEFDVMKIFKPKGQLWSIDMECYDDKDLEIIWEREEVQEYPELKEGMVIKTRDNRIYLIIKKDDELLFLNKEGYVFDFIYDEHLKSDELFDYDDDIMMIFSQSQLDIYDNVFNLRPSNMIWERKEN